MATASAPSTRDWQDHFHAPVASWFSSTFGEPTDAQRRAFPVIASGASTLLIAPTGSGKTLAAFLSAIERVVFRPAPRTKERPVRVLYVSPLKALATDIERNLRAPIAGILTAAARMGVEANEPSVAIRTGDTAAKERRSFARYGADILVTTPESLYLLLTSESRKAFGEVETVIVDEVHAVANQKRGSHLFLSLERLEMERTITTPLQRVGLSATQRPAERVARALCGQDDVGGERPCTVVDIGARRALDLKVEVPVEDMRRLGQSDDDKQPVKALAGPIVFGHSTGETDPKSIWPSIYPRLVELVREHTSTMIFVNNRRLSERLATAMNEVAGEVLALAHHGSIAHDKRTEIEDRLKSGTLPCIVATSSLELGIDMGAVDLVIQIEAPPSVASGMQRIGRSGHHAGGVSKGVIFPKYRGDLLSCAAAVQGMQEGAVETTTVPENPLDILAQQIVAMVSMEPIRDEDLFRVVRRAAPFAKLARASFDGVLDMLSGLYPSDDFAGLRPRVTYDRQNGMLSARHGARRIAVLSGGTIGDKGLYPVYARTGGEKPLRVGELDEEMVFESRVGDVFLLGASSWRIDEIADDRILVVPAPGVPGRMPFWRGDRPGRSAELGGRVGALARTIAKMPSKKAIDMLEKDHRLDERAARNLVEYVAEQVEATVEVPSDETIVVERFKDDLGDVRVALLTPWGARVHAAWSMAVLRRIRAERDLEVDAIWTDDGIAFRFPDIEDPPDNDLFFPRGDEVEELVLQGLEQTAMFAGHFRENAARALLLPRRSPLKRTPLWTQRKKASDLLRAVSGFGSFPVVLETYRECLRDALDLPALSSILKRTAERTIRVVTIDSRVPSPFAGALMFSYVANFIYDGDAPLAERRAQALSVDQERLRELLGEVELRELLDPEVIAKIEGELQGLSPKRVKHADGLVDLLLSLGDLSDAEIAARCEDGVDATALLSEIIAAKRAVRCAVAGEPRVIAIEDVARYRDALGIIPPPGTPSRLLEGVVDPLGDLVARYARTHGPFTAAEAAARLGTGPGVVAGVLRKMVARGRVTRGALLPGGSTEEHCDADVLRSIKRRTLARLRKEVEPVEPVALSRFVQRWHELERPRRGVEALLRAVEQLEGAPLVASDLLDEILPARVARFHHADLDYLCSTGEIVWCGLDPIGQRDGRIALYAADRLALLAPEPREPTHPLAPQVLAALEKRGATFFHDVVSESGAFGGEVFEALWHLVWTGHVTNDTLVPLRSLYRGEERERRARTRRAAIPGSEGRWSILPRARADASERALAWAKTMLERHGVVTRDVWHSESPPVTFSEAYRVLTTLEEAGRIRRGYFVMTLGGMQFARPGAEERLRAVRDPIPDDAPRVLAATDPANPYGAALPWPEGEPRPQRAASALVVLSNGALIGYVGRGGQTLTTFSPTDPAERRASVETVVAALLAHNEAAGQPTLTLSRIDGVEAAQHDLADLFLQRGFVRTARGLFHRAPGRLTRGDF